MNSLLNSPRGHWYRLLERINGGGGGEVYSALDQNGQARAIKFIRPDPHSRSGGLDTWINECNLSLKCLRHPHIVQIVEYFQTLQGHLVMVMEKANCSLGDLLAANYRFSTRAVCAVGMQVLQALDYIHSLPVIHRDVTPKNILVFPDWVYKLSDFGIAKNTITSEELAKTLIGHDSYLPPELLRYGYSKLQSDFYQLGIALLTLMTGGSPLTEGLSREQTFQQILDGIPRMRAEALIRLGGETGELARIVSVMLRRREAYRYQSALEIYHELAKLQSQPVASL
ncbi:MAG TPA: serine/threonine-protein kinase [Pyrinomonadaceae bacterium]